MKLNVAVLFGGRSVEHDVSIVTGLQALEQVNTQKYNAFPVYLARDGQFYAGEALKKVENYAQFDAQKLGLTPLSLSNTPGEGFVYQQKEKGGLFSSGKQTTVVVPVDVALLCLHGMHGEDGSLQGLLEMSDIAYTSPGVGGSAAGMDKALMKKVFAGCGFPSPKSLDFTRDEYEQDGAAIAARIEENLGFPVFVKPANLGSSIGISMVKEQGTLQDAIALALSYDRRVVVEQGVNDPMEINCSVLGYGADCRASLCEKPIGWQEFLTYEDKYINQGKGKGGSSRQIPAPIGEEMTQKIRTLACDIFKAMDCKGVVRIDFLVDQGTNEVYVNEINTIPGSLSFYLWEPTGLPYPALIDELVSIALRAKGDKKRNSYAYDSTILQKVRSGQGSKGTKGSKGSKRHA